MSENNILKQPGSPSEWYDLGCFFRKNARFGEAVNAFQQAVRMADELSSSCTDEKAALNEVRSKAVASIELIREINGFVNVDLMNP